MYSLLLFNLRVWTLPIDIKNIKGIVFNLLLNIELEINSKFGELFKLSNYFAGNFPFYTKDCYVLDNSLVIYSRFSNSYEFFVSLCSFLLMLILRLIVLNFIFYVLLCTLMYQRRAAIMRKNPTILMRHCRRRLFMSTTRQA